MRGRELVQVPCSLLSSSLLLISAEPLIVMAEVPAGADVRSEDAAARVTQIQPAPLLSHCDFDTGTCIK